MLPDELKIQELINVLREKRIGVVAHFYMDPEVQGVLTAAQKHWPHIHISDSLVMADTAVKMAKAGCQYITVLGVDFMAENVRAILDQAGFSEVVSSSFFFFCSFHIFFFLHCLSHLLPLDIDHHFQLNRLKEGYLAGEVIFLGQVTD